MRPRLAAALAALLIAAPAGAQTTYTSSAAWTAAVGAGNVSWTVDFSTFTSDTPFRTSPVDAGPFSLQQGGTGNFRNLVDVPAFEFADNNGTTHASMFTNFGATTVALTLDAPATAWGGDFNGLGTDSVEGLLLDLFGPGNTLLSSLTVTDGFFGFVLGAGQTVNRLGFRSATERAGDVGEGFTLDNVRGVDAAASAVVPEPSTYLLLGTGLLAIGGVARRRRA